MNILHALSAASIIFAAVATAAGPGCLYSDAGIPDGCTDGNLRECQYHDANGSLANGEQRCTDQNWGECGPSVFSNGTGGTGGGSNLCQPGDVQFCTIPFDGGVADGKTVCDANGVFGECTPLVPLPPPSLYPCDADPAFHYEVLGGNSSEAGFMGALGAIIKVDPACDLLLNNAAFLVHGQTPSDFVTGTEGTYYFDNWKITWSDAGVEKLAMGPDSMPFGLGAGALSSGEMFLGAAPPLPLWKGEVLWLSIRMNISPVQDAPEELFAPGYGKQFGIQVKELKITYTDGTPVPADRIAATLSDTGTFTVLSPP